MHILSEDESVCVLYIYVCCPLLSMVTDMEGAIKTVVMQYLSSARGKENLSGKNFQKLVQSQMGSILSVRS